MSLESRLDAWSRGWRAPVFAALVALIAGLPGLFAMPPLDRDESRFTQATAQMLETGDYVNIRLQDQPRNKKPVGIHWLQAVAVSAVSAPEDRGIWAYRIPSLLGAMLAAAACAWGAAAFFGPRESLLSGAILGATFLLSTEAFIAKTDASLCGFTTLAMAGLARIYAASLAGEKAGKWPKLAFWIGMAMAALIKGPVGLLVVLLAGLALWAWDRKAPWARQLGWSWGLILFAAIVLPWAWMITVATDGAFWGAAVGGDLAPKLAGGHERHGGIFGYYALLSPLLLFPVTLLLPAALVLAWTGRKEPGVRFALCWLIPTWLMFELLPTKLAHYTLPAFGALAMLMAAALRAPLGLVSRIVGTVLLAIAGFAFAAVCVVAWKQYAAPSTLPLAILSALLFVASALAGGWLILRRQAAKALVTAGVLGVLAHGTMAGLLAPRLDSLWLSQRLARALEKADLAPRAGAFGPVAVTGYSEPSMVFQVGTTTQLTDADGAADAVDEGRPAVVEGREDAKFRAALAALGHAPRPAGEIKGLNYSDGDDEVLRIYRGEPRRHDAVERAEEEAQP
ncbi:ArnT family glycosyltransferase [Caulobacter hibisci]|uniref:Glycosyltransferase family 39 protein n=1 Tax=Caulobacter hibisci TaxID=2035993 RepID=A0ABS0SZ62_9CAUL|nr:glycosyltransferase family 39 protein [Caulobacter hibisci]MBI1684834.1 glycosyltransferase family 39 protein [Caulobacter hibisci]